MSKSPPGRVGTPKSDISSSFFLPQAESTLAFGSSAKERSDIVDDNEEDSSTLPPLSNSRVDLSGNPLDTTVIDAIGRRIGTPIQRSGSPVKLDMSVIYRASLAEFQAMIQKMEEKLDGNEARVKEMLDLGEESLKSCEKQKIELMSSI